MYLNSVTYLFSDDSKQGEMFCVLSCSIVRIISDRGVYLALRLSFHHCRVCVHAELNVF